MEYPIIHDCKFTIGENPYIPRACKLRPNSFLCREQFKFNSFIRLTSRTREIRVKKEARANKWVSCENSSDSISDARMWRLRWFNFPLMLASGISSIYLFSLNLSSEGHGDQTPLFGYACEDVSYYYAHTENLEGQALKKELHTISSSHQSLSYKKIYIRDALKILDAVDVDNPDASSEIVEIYSLRAVSKSIAGKLEGWNREHLWPRSYGLTYGPSLTDLHNIRPADVNVNSSRGNKYFGECLTNSTNCMKPANKEAASDTETDKERWAPPFQVRGDIARAIMYMAVRYGFHQPGGSPILHLSDSPSVRNREMGLLSTLLKWNILDPPSRAEQLRNDRVCRLYQHNRNPFVDHPEYATLIWNQSSVAWTNEFHYTNRDRDSTEVCEPLNK